jgi:hypothetical protein
MSFTSEQLLALANQVDFDDAASHAPLVRNAGIMGATTLGAAPADAPAPATLASGSDIFNKFKLFWPTVKAVLQTVKAVTGPKVDKVIDEVIKVGDTIANPNADPAERSQAIAKFRDLWPLVSTPIRLVAVAIPGKVGKVVRTFIELADAISESDAPAAGADPSTALAADALSSN